MSNSPSNGKRIRARGNRDERKQELVRIVWSVTITVPSWGGHTAEVVAPAAMIIWIIPSKQQYQSRCDSAIVKREKEREIRSFLPQEQ